MLVRRLASLACLIVLASCSSDSGPTDPGNPDGDGTFTVGSLGGSFEAVSQGARVQVQVPPGAVMEDTEFTLRAIEAQELASFEVGPAGVPLREAVTITVEIPDAWENPEAIGASMGRAESRAAVPGTYNPSTRELTITSHYMGFPSQLPLALPKDGAASAMEEGAVTPLDFSQVDCDLELIELQVKIEQTRNWITAGGYVSIVGEPITALGSQYQVHSELCGDPDISNITNALMVQACELYFNEIVNIEAVLPPENQEDLIEWLQPIIAAEAVKQAIEVNCAADLLDSILVKALNRYIDRLIDRFETEGYLEENPWPTVWSEMSAAATGLRSAGSLWDVDPIVDRVNQDLLPRQYAQFRIAAFNECQGEFHDQSYLADLQSGGFLRNHPIEAEPGVPWWSTITAQQFLEDAQYCASPLEIEIYDALSELLESAALGPGDGPGQHQGAIEIFAPYDGFIDLRGPIRALTCYLGGSSSLSSDQLILRADDELIETLDPVAGAFLTTPYDLSVALLLE